MKGTTFIVTNHNESLLNKSNLMNYLSNNIIKDIFNECLGNNFSITISYFLINNDKL